MPVLDVRAPEWLETAARDVGLPPVADDAQAVPALFFVYDDFKLPVPSSLVNDGTLSEDISRSALQAACPEVYNVLFGCEFYLSEHRGTDKVELRVFDFKGVEDIPVASSYSMLAAVRGADAARAMWPQVQTLGQFTISMALATANILRTDSPSRPSVRAPVVLHSTRSSTCASNYQSFTRPRDFACSSPFGSGGKLSTRTASSPGSFAQGSRTPAPFGRGKPRHQTSSPSALLASAGLTGFPESISQEPAARDAHRANFRGFLARMREHSAETSGCHD